MAGSKIKIPTGKGMFIKKNIKRYVMRNLVIFENDVCPRFNDDSNIFEMGYVNSLFAMKLVRFIEAKYRIKVPNEELRESNFKSINIIALFVRNRLLLKVKKFLTFKNLVKRGQQLCSQ